MEPIKLLREAYGSECECTTESTIHKWHFTFSKNLNKEPLHEKKDGQPRISITETNISIVQAVIDDNQHLSTRAVEALLHIPQMIIHHILKEKLMVHRASTWVPHMLTSDPHSFPPEAKCESNCN